jgi:heptosyltransferase-3
MMEQYLKNHHSPQILVSRIDNIGDVILTLPLCGVLKEKFPHCKIHFLGKTYTEDIIKRSAHVDYFHNYDQLKLQHDLNFWNQLKIDFAIHVFPNQLVAKWFKQNKIPYRLGTNRRWFHYLYCNLRSSLSRAQSSLHEAQLNIKLLEPFLDLDPALFQDKPSILAKYYGWKKENIFDAVSPYLSRLKKNIIFHPLSHGSAMEWGMNNYLELLKKLDPQKFNVIITGSAKEKEMLHQALLSQTNFPLTDTTGKLTLRELINLIEHSDYLIAASTGPLHIASASGITSIGLYSRLKPFYPQRWGAIGQKSINLTSSNKQSEICLADIKEIRALDILPIIS